MPPTTIFSLSTPMIQLLFSEVGLKSDPGISAHLDNAITANFSSPQPNITGTGLSPLLVRLLSSPKDKRRTWAISHLPACARRPLSFEEWCHSGVGEEVQALYSGTGGASTADRLAGIEALLRSGALSPQVVEKGVLGGQLDEISQDRSEQGLMATLSHLLGGQRDREIKSLCCRSYVVEN